MNSNTTDKNDNYDKQAYISIEIVICM